MDFRDGRQGIGWDHCQRIRATASVRSRLFCYKSTVSCANCDDGCTFAFSGRIHLLHVQRTFGVWLIRLAPAPCPHWDGARALRCLGTFSESEVLTPIDTHRKCLALNPDKLTYFGRTVYLRTPIRPIISAAALTQRYLTSLDNVSQGCRCSSKDAKSPQCAVVPDPETKRGLHSMNSHQPDLVAGSRLGKASCNRWARSVRGSHQFLPSYLIVLSATRRSMHPPSLPPRRRAKRD
jgi:hypothetical protein